MMERDDRVPDTGGVTQVSHGQPCPTSRHKTLPRNAEQGKEQRLRDDLEKAMLLQWEEISMKPMDVWKRMEQKNKPEGTRGGADRQAHKPQIVSEAVKNSKTASKDASDTGSETAGENAFKAARENAIKATSEDAFKVASKDAFKVASKDAFKAASEDAFKAASKDAFKVASKDAFKAASEDAFKAARENAFKVASKDAFKVASEDAFKATSEDAFMVTRENAFKTTSEDAFKVASKDAFKVASEDATKVASEALQPTAEAWLQAELHMAIKRLEAQSNLVALQKLEKGIAMHSQGINERHTEEEMRRMKGQTAEKMDFWSQKDDAAKQESPAMEAERYEPKRLGAGTGKIYLNYGQKTDKLGSTIVEMRGGTAEEQLAMAKHIIQEQQSRIAELERTSAQWMRKYMEMKRYGLESQRCIQEQGESIKCLEEWQAQMWAKVNMWIEIDRKRVQLLETTEKTGRVTAGNTNLTQVPQQSTHQLKLDPIVLHERGERLKHEMNAPMGKYREKEEISVVRQQSTQDLIVLHERGERLKQLMNAPMGKYREKEEISVVRQQSTQDLIVLHERGERLKREMNAPMGKDREKEEIAVVRQQSTQDLIVLHERGERLKREMNAPMGKDREKEEIAVVRQQATQDLIVLHERGERLKHEMNAPMGKYREKEEISVVRQQSTQDLIVLHERGERLKQLMNAPMGKYREKEEISVVRQQSTQDLIVLHERGERLKREMNAPMGKDREKEEIAVVRQQATQDLIVLHERGERLKHEMNAPMGKDREKEKIAVVCQQATQQPIPSLVLRQKIAVKRHEMKAREIEERDALNRQAERQMNAPLSRAREKEEIPVVVQGTSKSCKRELQSVLQEKVTERLAVTAVATARSTGLGSGDVQLLKRREELKSSKVTDTNTGDGLSDQQPQVPEQKKKKKKSVVSWVKKKMKFGKKG
ncbi:uncharacterized protein LOC134437705 [Engraulis encrasicolus]|uniref:uncharacterized protein LOC134437705 n=1 Tax=Engraulis encrasicolus TaxID=184585 RepID=UPI002FD4A1F6